MPLTSNEQMTVELTKEVERLKSENRKLKEKCSLNERKIEVIIGSVDEGEISIYFNDSNAWESQVPKVDGLGRYVTKKKERYYVQPMLSDFRTYVFSEKQAEMIRKSFRNNGSGIGGYSGSISNDIVCKNYLYKLYHDLCLRDIHEEVLDEDELKLLDLLYRDTGNKGHNHKQIDFGYSLELIKAVQKVLSKTKIHC
ncbi:hypothetical protein QK289_15615 [Exiguobacterium antarcticum]|uniref:Uncharacterized protein n=1 Tax=Exiguobacterium antarcticum TaxID=132920 RepID=A0ABT6R6H2_9BACL|nr:hypothetical protein [Exiguobacterium antarcticum]MDI3236443.1 hypothetical protein [Exiguobacterium antarcticum]